MEEVGCKSCVYCLKAVNKEEITICVNRAGEEGRVYVIDEDGGQRTEDRGRRTEAGRQMTDGRGVCRNYKRFVSSERLEIEQPIDEEVRLIPLTRGKFAIVDKEDFARLSQYKWHSLFNGRKTYANRSFAGRNISMHRFIMRPARGMVVDHIDGNGLNNTRGNLRVCTARENLLNSRPRGKTSRFKGVCRHRGKWQVSMKIKGKNKYIGSFEGEIEAARAYDRAAKKYLGRFAYLNYPWLVARVSSL